MDTKNILLTLVFKVNHQIRNSTPVTRRIKNIKTYLVQCVTAVER